MVLAAPPARAEDQNGGWAGDWLTSYRSARAMGLGGSFVSLADEPMGMVWNPAGLTQLERNEVVLETSRYFEGTSLTTLGITVPGRRYPTLGLAILALRSDEFRRTNDVNDDLGTFTEGETAYVLSASHNLHPRLAVGGNLRLVHQSIDEFSATGLGFDLGVLARVGENVRLGGSVAHLGGPALELRDTSETYPRQLRGGAAVDLLQGRATICAEVERIGDLRTNVRGGAEYALSRVITLRAGFDGADPAGGFSVNLPGDLRLDYGTGGHDLGMIHRLGVSWRFGGFFASSQASPEVFSLLGDKATTSFALAARTRYAPQSWRLEIRDLQGQVVREFGGQGAPPAHLTWDGKNGAGVPAPDGALRVRADGPRRPPVGPRRASPGSSSSTPGRATSGCPSRLAASSSRTARLRPPRNEAHAFTEPLHGRPGRPAAPGGARPRAGRRDAGRSPRPGGEDGSGHRPAAGGRLSGSCRAVRAGRRRATRTGPSPMTRRCAGSRPWRRRGRTTSRETSGDPGSQTILAVR